MTAIDQATEGSVKIALVVLEALGDNEGLLALFTTDSLQQMQRLSKCTQPLPGERSWLWEKATHCVALQNSHHLFLLSETQQSGNRTENPLTLLASSTSRAHPREPA